MPSPSACGYGILLSGEGRVSSPLRYQSISDRKAGGLPKIETPKPRRGPELVEGGSKKRSQGLSEWTEEEEGTNGGWWPGERNPRYQKIKQPHILDFKTVRSPSSFKRRPQCAVNSELSAFHESRCGVYFLTKLRRYCLPSSEQKQSAARPFYPLHSMTKKQMFAAMRWALVPFAAVFGYIAALVLALPLNRLIYLILTSNGEQMGNKPFIEYVIRYDGALTASLVLVCGSFMAPAYRRQVAALLLLIGGLFAWNAVGHSYSFMDNKEGPIREWSPIVGTYLGGLATFAILCIVFRTKNAASP